MECSLHRKPWTTDGPESNLFGLEPNFGCCTANFHQGWPKFAASLFMLSHDDGLVAAPTRPAKCAQWSAHTPVHIVEETDYPFRGVVRLTINPASPLAFPLLLRIPAMGGWDEIRVNNQLQPQPAAGLVCTHREDRGRQATGWKLSSLSNRASRAGSTVRLRWSAVPWSSLTASVKTG